MKRAIPCSASRDAGNGCGYFLRGLPQVFQAILDGARPSRHGV